MKKKGASLMVAYTILVVIGIALGTATYSYLKLYLPSVRAECPADISVSIERVACDTTKDELRISILNRGLFNIPVLFVRFGEEGRRVKEQLNDGKEILPFPLSPNDTIRNFVYKIAEEIIDGKYVLEIQPGIIVKRVIVPCDRAIVSIPIRCIAGGGGRNGEDGTCNDGRKNGDETEVDCGGSCIIGTEAGECRDELDNDKDCFIDCADSDCGSDANCQTCTPKTFEEVCIVEKECGKYSDGCGGTIDCGACIEGEYCDVSGECRKFISCEDDYDKTDQSLWWFLRENWFNDGGSGLRNPLGVYLAGECIIKYERGEETIIETYKDKCLDKTTLQQYYCVDKNDDYGKNYQKCENLRDFIYNRQYFDCKNDYYGPHCIIDGNPTSCDISCSGGVSGACAPYWNSQDGLCYGPEFPTQPDNGQDYCVVENDLGSCFHGSIAC